jgi:phage replication O-like protein O
MSPQKENGYTAIANEIIDALVKYRLSGEQMQCLLFILRKTYGYNKKTDAISLSQFVKATGINRGNVARAIKAITAKKLIHVIRGSVNKDTISITKYRFNKRFKSWLSSVKKDTGSVIIAKKVVSKKTHTKASITKEEPLPHKNAGEDVFYLTKKNRKLKDTWLNSFDQFWSAFNYKKDKASAADSWLDINPMTGKIFHQIIAAAKSEASIRHEKLEKGLTPIYAQGWLTAKRWEDEIEPLNGNDPVKIKTQEEIDAEDKEYGIS